MFLLLSIAAASIAQPAPLPALQPLSSFVGHCWSGPAPGGAGVDTHCFESVYAGRHIRDRHKVTSKGKTIYAGETLYSVEGGKISFTYWNSLGGIGRGTAREAGRTLNFTGDIHATPTSAVQPLFATWRKLGRSYEVREDPNSPPRTFRRLN